MPYAAQGKTQSGVLSSLSFLVSRILCGDTMVNNRFYWNQFSTPYTEAFKDAFPILK